MHSSGLGRPSKKVSFECNFEGSGHLIISNGDGHKAGKTKRAVRVMGLDLIRGLREGFPEEVTSGVRPEGGFRVNRVWSSWELGKLEEVKEARAAGGDTERGGKSVER